MARQKKDPAGLVTPAVEGKHPNGDWTDDKLAGYRILANFPEKPNFLNVMAFIFQATHEMETAGLSREQIQDNTGMVLSENEEEENDKEDEQSTDLDNKPKALDFNKESDTLLCIQQSAESLSFMAETQGQMNKALEKFVAL